VSEGGHVPDVFLFDLFRSSVDPATQNWLRAMRKKEPDLTFAKFWQTVDREFTRDHENARRCEWEAISIPHGQLSLLKWREYRNAFEVALSLKQKVSDREIEEKILRDLPGEWHEKLAKQCAQKAHGKHWVKVLKPCTLNRARLEQALALANRGRIPQLEERSSEFIVECNSEEVKEIFFEMDVWDIPGVGLLEVKWAARKPTWTEMFKLLEAELRVEADLAPLRTRTKGVNAVTETAPPPNPPPRKGRQPTKGKGKSKGKGKVRAWSPAKGQGKPEARRGCRQGVYSRATG
jgi:hypothetical protein